MIPKQGQRVKLIFRNGLVEEGVVVSWSDKTSVLKAFTSDVYLVINNTNQDIIAFKIFQDISQPKPQQIYDERPLEVKGPAARDPVLRAKNLAELRVLRGDEEKRRAREHLTTFHNKGSISSVQYGIPTRLKKPPITDPT